MGAPVISVEGLRKSYADLEAVRGIDLRVEAGEVFAFLGPNGAGKTTTVEVLEGYRGRQGGRVSVLGHDPSRPTRAWRQRVGIVLQECRLQPELTVRESVAMYAGYYPAPRRVGETIDLVGLAGKADARAGSLSGGQQRRLDVALALIGDPDLLFLDEPTTGFDPSARRQAWGVIESLRDLGKTVFLTTHYMDEAQELADRAAVIVAGRIVAAGTPDEIGGRAQAPSVISFWLPEGVDASSLPEEVGPGAEIRDRHVVLATEEPTRALSALTKWALERRIELRTLEVRRPSLEDVYLRLTAEDGR